MKPNFFKKIKSAAKFSIIFGLLNLPDQALAADIKSIGQKIKDTLIRTGESAGFAPKGTGDNVNFIKILGAYINGLLTLMGVLFLLLIIYGGFMWMSAAGNEDRVSKAKKIIMGAAIGIAIILLSMVITNFVLDIFSTAVITS